MGQTAVCRALAALGVLTEHGSLGFRIKGAGFRVPRHLIQKGLGFRVRQLGLDAQGFNV